jgi:YggT family protein
MGNILLDTWNLFFSLMFLLILARVILSWLPQYRGSQIGQIIFSLTDPVLRPIQNLIPPMGMMDISPIVAWIALAVIQTIGQTIITTIFNM